MSATVHLVVGPPGADRAARLLAAYRAAAAAGFGAALLLAPTRRHADQLRHRLAAAPTALLAPHIHDVQAFADELVRANDPSLRPHADADRRLLLDAVLAELIEAGELPYFAAVAETRGFGDAAAGYVAELSAAGVDLRALLKASPPRQTPLGELTRHAQAARVYERYQRRLARLHRLDPGDRLGRAAELWAAGRRGPFTGVRAVFVTGVTALAPYRRKLFDALRDTADDFWIELPAGDGEAFTDPAAVRAWATAPVGEATLFNPTPDVTEERVEVEAGRPAGIRWLGTALFRASGDRQVAGHTPTLDTGDLTVAARPDPAGLHLIEAPGALGEARLVARRVRTLLANGVSPARVVVTARQLDPVAVSLWREVFDEYGVPHDAAGADPLARVPAVAFLLRAWRLAADDWPFAAVAAVLRSTYFRPDWAEARADPELPARAETLLRLLGETRRRDAYLGAVRAWEHTPPEPLEDEQGDEPRRKRVQRLAGRCRPFLEKFFAAWDRFKPAGTAEALVVRLRAFADDTGLSLAARADPADAAGLARLWRELGRWAKAEGGRKVVRTDRFARVLAGIAAVPCQGRSPRDAGRVRLVAAERAAGLDCDFLFLTGLGEGSWPNLAGPVSLLDDAERERLRKAGVGLPDPAGRLAAEQLLFLQLAAAPRRELVLSYPAVDGRGHALLPCTFLRAATACFPAGTIPTTRQRMLVEGYFTQEPLSAAEWRVQWAGRTATARSPVWGEEPATSRSPLAGDLLDNLARARQLAAARFHDHAFGPYDGQLRHPAVAAALAARFGPERVFSPTALETYVACPFRFWLEHVLRLDVLDDPAEEVEHTRRGAAFHRALARLHAWVKEVVPQTLAGPDLPAGVSDHLLGRVEEAVEEYARRAPSVATRELWRLEGERLKRAAARYRGHWQAFRAPWREKNAAPVPHRFEADFGMPGEGVPEALTIAVGGVEVRLGGRIDRIDVADLGDGVGFWVIDYKTGRGANYSAAQVERFEKLQLPLYALAVERVLLKGRPARPLGLAYWLVTDAGPKAMLPAGKKAALSWLADPGRWERFRGQLEAWVAELVGRVRAGDFPLAPRSDHCTDTCGFGPVCRIAQARGTGKINPLTLPLLPKEKDAKADG